MGFFFDGGTGEPEGLVSDQQIGYQPATEVAGFFLAKFLGCRLLQDPRTATKHFFLAAQDFINDRIVDPGKRTSAINHLLSELTSNRNAISIRSFARDYLPTNLRNDFEKHIKMSGVVGATIKKNLELVETQLQKLSIELEDDVTVAGPREAMLEQVKVTAIDGGAARIEIVGKLKKVRGR